MNKRERDELEKARLFQIRKDNEAAAEQAEYELSRVSCGLCPKEDCVAPDCPHAKRVDPEISK